MAYSNSNNPITSGFGGVQQGSPSVSSQYVFADLLKPDFSDYITYRYSQYSITTLLSRIGRKESVLGNTEFNWFEKGLFRTSFTIGAGSSGLTGATATVKLLSTTVATCGLLVDDVVRFENDDYGQVTAIAQNSGDVDLTIAKAGGSANFALVAGDKFAMLYNAKKEFSDSGNGRVWPETKKTEKLAIIRRNVICSTTEASSIKWVTAPNGQKSYYFINEMETLNEMAKDREMYILAGKSFGTLSPTAAQSGNGIVPRVLEDGVVGTFAGAVSESDIQEQIRLMCVNNAGEEMTVLCGSEFYSDAQRALKDYVLNGGVVYGSLSAEGLAVGLNITQYKFMGKILNLVWYTMFDDPGTHPTPVRGGINWSNAALILNMGSDERNNPLINLRYQEDLLGNSLEFTRTVQSGITTPEGGTGVNRANGKDGFTVDLYSSIGVQMRGANVHGLLYKN